jgi:hypothetical protein
VFDVGIQDGIDFLVMEYLEGETLTQRLNDASPDGQRFLVSNAVLERVRGAALSDLRNCRRIRPVTRWSR